MTSDVCTVNVLCAERGGKPIGFFLMKQLGQLRMNPAAVFTEHDGLRELQTVMFLIMVYGILFLGNELS